jgi:hypothetical protein
VIWLAVGMAVLAGFAAGWVLGIAYGVRQGQDDARGLAEFERLRVGALRLRLEEEVRRRPHGPPLMTYTEKPRVLPFYDQDDER